MKLLLLSALLSATTVMAAVNGRCSGSNNNGYCICVSKSTCAHYHGKQEPGTKGDYACPNDPADIVGCYIGKCKSSDVNSVCAFTSSCINGQSGTPIPGNLCPGGNNFICCHAIGP